MPSPSSWGARKSERFSQLRSQVKNSLVYVPYMYRWHVSTQEGLYRGMCTEACVSGMYTHAWMSCVFPIDLALCRWAVITEMDNFLLVVALFHFSKWTMKPCNGCSGQPITVPRQGMQSFLEQDSLDGAHQAPERPKARPGLPPHSNGHLLAPAICRPE